MQIAIRLGFYGWPTTLKLRDPLTGRHRDLGWNHHLRPNRTSSLGQIHSWGKAISLTPLFHRGPTCYGLPWYLSCKESTCNARDPWSIPGSARSAREGIGYPSSILGLPWWLSWWRIHLHCGRSGFRKIPWRRERLPTPVFWPGEFHGLYSPWG